MWGILPSSEVGEFSELYIEDPPEGTEVDQEKAAQ